MVMEMSDGRPAGAGPLALVGSGEYLPVMASVEAGLLAGRPARYVQIPLAAGREGEQSLRYWTRLGQEQAERLGVESVPIVVRDAAEANDPGLAAEVAGAGLIYLSGGDPHYLATNLRGTLLWEAVHREWLAGAALAGCSAGAMALTSWVPVMRQLHRDVDAGLGVLPHVRVIPHFDKMLGWAPDIITKILIRPPDGVYAIGIDEETALVGGPDEWRVEGRQSVWLIEHGSKTEFAPGSTVRTPRLG